MSKRLAGLLVVLVAVMASPALASAEAKYTLSLTKDYTASPWTEETGWANRFKGKLLFGAKNLLLGWTDLFTEPQEAVSDGGNFFVGLGYGLKDALENELGGVVHLVTSPITAIDAPLPEGGTQLFQ